MRVYNSVCAAAALLYVCCGRGATCTKVVCTATGIAVDDMFERWIEYDGRLATDGNDIALFDAPRSRCYVVRGGSQLSMLSPGECIADIEATPPVSSLLLSQNAERFMFSLARVVDLFERGKRTFSASIKSLSLFPDEINLRNAERGFSTLKNTQRAAQNDILRLIEVLNKHVLRGP